jgi:hypothetical protein
LQPLLKEESKQFTFFLQSSDVAPTAFANSPPSTGFGAFIVMLWDVSDPTAKLHTVL